MDQKVIKGGEKCVIYSVVIHSYPLRPELIESMMYHDVVFNNNEMVEWGRMILHSLNNTKTKVLMFSVDDCSVDSHPFIISSQVIWKMRCLPICFQRL